MFLFYQNTSAGRKYLRLVKNIVCVNQAFCDILLSHLYHGQDDRMIIHFSEKCQRDEIIKKSSKENMSL